MTVANRVQRVSLSGLQALLHPGGGVSEGAAGSSFDVAYVADDHGLGREVTGMCRVYPHLLARETVPGIRN